MGVRFRRDFVGLLGLIKSSAILHQASRSRNAEGQIIATIADYANAYALVNEIISIGLEAAVSDTVKETVEAVTKLCKESISFAGSSDAFVGITVKQVADELCIDASAALRRVKAALSLRYIINDETHRYKPYKLKLGDPLPREIKVLPRPDELE